MTMSKTNSRVSNSADNGAGPSKPADYFLSDPFRDWDATRMEDEVQNFIKEAELEDYENYIRRGAILNHDTKAFERERRDGLRLKPIEKQYLDQEFSPRKIDKFKQAGHLWILVGLCSLGAAVQGWDESAVNGAQIYYQYALPPLTDTKNDLIGLVNSAPYLCCTVSCLLTYPLNKYLGRRGTIFLTCLISSVACLGQAFPQTWGQLFVARLLLGLGIGPKSATIPIYAAECAPANVRGALVMMWQMWTAFGIMCGYIAGVLLQNATAGNLIRYPVPAVSLNLQNADVGSITLVNQTVISFNHSNVASVLGSLQPTTADQCARNTAYSAGVLTCDNKWDPVSLNSLRCSLNWRMMLASPMLLPLIVVCYIYCLPESPRWLLRRAHHGETKRYEQAFLSLCKLRHTKLQAARDLFLMNHQLREEEHIRTQSKPIIEMFTKPRNRRALTASSIVMFFQQFCGVNVMAYYSSQVFLQAGLSVSQALVASMGFGIINFLFALPAVWTIDSFGRRGLLLSMFPLMAASQLILSIAFAATNPCTRAQRALVLLGMYLFAAFYSPSEGPVPFVYSAESMPLYNRDFGMGLVTGLLWFFNFVLAITWPSFVRSFRNYGAFAYYACWCVIGEIAILLFVPETKDLTLEELAQVFDIPTRQHMTFGMRQAAWVFRRYVLRQKTGSGSQAPILLQRGNPEDVIEKVYHGEEDIDVSIPLSNMSTGVDIGHSISGAGMMGSHLRMPEKKDEGSSDDDVIESVDH